MIIRIFRHFLPLPLVILALMDAAISYASIFAAGWLLGSCALGCDVASPKVAGLVGETPWPLLAAAFAATMFVSLAATGLYSARQRSRFLGLVTRLVFAVSGATLASAGLLFVFSGADADHDKLVVAAVLSFAAFLVCRLVLEAFVNDAVFKRRVIVYGSGHRAATITQLRRRSDRRGFTLIGYVSTEEGRKPAVPAEECFSADEGLLSLCSRLDIDEVVVAMDDRRRRFPMHELLECRLEGIEVIELISFFERESGKIRLDMMNPSWMIFAPGFRRGWINSVLERAFDVLASAALLMASAPIALLTMLAIKLEDGWRASVLYGQARVGQYGRDFRLLKFRSMREDAEHDGRARWAVKNDNRVTRVGAFIRLTRIDEIPQIFNVLRGEMSFVGPRPERPQFVSALNEKIPYYRERHAIKPGITGWAQLCYPYGASEQDAVEKLQYDLYYVKNHSLIFYLAILLQTVEVIVWRKGAR